MVTYLAGLGHRRIAHISGPRRQRRSQRERSRDTGGNEGRGLQVDPELVWEGDFHLGSGIAAAGRYLASANRPTAVFAGNDQMAMGFQQR